MNSGHYILVKHSVFFPHINGTMTLSKYVRKLNSKSVDTLGHSSLLCIEFWHKLPSNIYLLPILKNWKIKNQNMKNVKFQIRWDCERDPGYSASILEKFSGNSGGGGSGRKEQMSASPSSFPNHNHHHPFNHIFHHLFLIVIILFQNRVHQLLRHPVMICLVSLFQFSSFPFQLLRSNEAVSNQ